MVEWQKLATKMIGDDIGGSFASNSGVATFQDDFTSFATQPNADANWPPVGTEIIVNIITDVIDWDFVRVGANRGVSFDLYQHGKFATDLATTGNWGLRWKMTQGSPQTQPSSSVIEGYVGLYADPSTQSSGVVQDFIALRFSWTSANVKAIQLLAESVNAPENAVVQDTFSTVWNTSETQFFELKRTSPTTMEATIYSDANYSVIVEKRKVTGISSAIDSLRYIKVHNNDGSAVGGTFNGVIDDIEFFVNSEGLQDFFTAKGTIKAIDFDIFPDLLTGSNTADFVANFSSTTGWTSTDASKVRIEDLQNFLFIRSVVDNSNDSIANDVFGGTISNTWVLRGSLNITDFISDNANQKVIFIGMWTINQVLGSSSAQDAIYLAIACDNSLGNNTGLAWIAHVDNQVATNKAHDADFTYDVFNPMLEGRFFFELKRTSATTVEATIFGDEGFTDALQTINATIPSSVSLLRFFKISNRVDVATGEIGATIDELEFYDGVTNTCTFNSAPVLPQDSTKAFLDFCGQFIFYDGAENFTNFSISVDLGTTLSDSAWVMRCKILEGNLVAIGGSTTKHWIGMFDISSQNGGGGNAQSGIALRADPQNGVYNATSNADTVLENWGAEATYVDVPFANGTIYLEIARLSSTLARMSIFNDANFNELIESRTFTILATVNDLQFFKIAPRGVVATSARWEILVSDIEIWDNVTNADGFPDFRYLDIQTKGNALNGLIDIRYLFNSDDELAQYSRHTSINGATDVRTSDRGYNVEQTPTDTDHYSFLIGMNRSGFPKQFHGYDTVQANAFGPANVPDRTESVGIWRNTVEQLNKIQVRNTQAGDYDTDSEIVVFGTD